MKKKVLIVVTVPANRSHGIPSGQPLPFNSLMQLTHAIEQAMSGAGIRVHTAPTRALYE